MAETENKYVKKISDEKKLEIINASVQNLSARPTSNATDMKKRFVMPIVNKDGRPCLADEVDRVAGEADKAIKDVHGELAVKELQIQVVNSKADKNTADIKTLQGNVTELSANDAEHNTRFDAVEKKLADTENGLNAVANQAGSNGEAISEIDYTINNALAANIRVSVDENYVVTIQLLNQSGLELGSKAKIDLPTEELIISGSYDEATKQIVLVTREGKEIKVPVGDLVDGLLSSSEKGAANGVASLDENGKVPAEQLPEGIGGGLPEGFNPEDYVKFTDYATANKAGVIKMTASWGINIGGSGIAYIVSANNTEIDAKKTTYKPISPGNLDHAVKVGVTTNIETLTDEEKTSACEWLGAVKAITKEYGENVFRVYCIDNKGNQQIVRTTDSTNVLSSKKYVDDGFVAKMTGESDSGATRGFAYGLNSDGNAQQLYRLQIQSNAGTIPLRNGSGTFYVGTPTLPYECVNKGYVDDKFLAKKTGLTGEVIITQKPDGTTDNLAYTTEIANLHMVRRTIKGDVLVPDNPVDPSGAVNSKYVDNALKILEGEVEITIPGTSVEIYAANVPAYRKNDPFAYIGAVCVDDSNHLIIGFSKSNNTFIVRDIETGETFKCESWNINE